MGELQSGYENELQILNTILSLNETDRALLARMADIMHNAKTRIQTDNVDRQPSLKKTKRFLLGMTWTTKEGC